MTREDQYMACIRAAIRLDVEFNAEQDIMGPWEVYVAQPGHSFAAFFEKNPADSRWCYTDVRSYLLVQENGRWDTLSEEDLNKWMSQFVKK